MTSQLAGSGGDYVVVGVDGSESATRALIWALRLAARNGWAVRVVTAWPEPAAVFVREVPGHYSAPRQRAVRAQRAALAEARRAVPRLPRVDTDIVNAHPVEALLDQAAGARVVVVGSRGDAPPTHTGRASVGDTLARLVTCPLVVIRDETAAAAQSREPALSRSTPQPRR